MDDRYLIPANSKKSMLILGLFTELDLIILGNGVGVTLLMVLFIKLDNIIFTLLSLLPALVSGLLVMPIPNYRNFRIFATELYNFFTRRQRYVWKGWCASDEYK